MCVCVRDQVQQQRNALVVGSALMNGRERAYELVVCREWRNHLQEKESDNEKCA